MLKKRAIHDTFLDEFLYNLIYKSTRSQRAQIPQEYLYVFNSSLAAKKFVSKATLEQKLYLFTLLGLRWYLVFGDSKKMQKDLREILALLREDRRGEGAEAMTEKNVFVFSGEQFIDCMGIMASLNHHKTYSFNLEIQKTGYHLKKWKKDTKYGNYNKVSENNENLESIISFVLQNVLNGMSIEANLAIKLRDLCILLYLRINKHAFTSHEKIVNYFGGYYVKQEIAVSLRELCNKELVRTSSLTIEKEYMITALGINKINQYVSTALATNF